MTLTIRPVKLKQSIYLRVPSDIADLIGFDPNAAVTLNLEERDGEFLLVYHSSKTATEISERPSRQHQNVRSEHEIAPIPETGRG